MFKRLEWGGSKNAALVVGLLAWLYARGPSLRGPIRKELGRWLEQQRLQGERIKHAHMQPVLQVWRYAGVLSSGVGADYGVVSFFHRLLVVWGSRVLRRKRPGRKLDM